VQALLKAARSEVGARNDRMLHEAEARRGAEQAPPRVEEMRRAARADAESTRAEPESASRPSMRWKWTVAVLSGLLIIISLGAISYFVWRSPFASATAYARAGNFACFDGAEYPDNWRDEASLCAPYGCNFGKMSRDACLALGVRKQSKTVIHGNAGTSRANECWLQHSCADLRPHGEFTMFRQ